MEQAGIISWASMQEHRARSGNQTTGVLQCNLGGHHLERHSGSRICGCGCTVEAPSPSHHCSKAYACVHMTIPLQDSFKRERAPSALAHFAPVLPTLAAMGMCARRGATDIDMSLHSLATVHSALPAASGNQRSQLSRQQLGLAGSLRPLTLPHGIRASCGDWVRKGWTILNHLYSGFRVSGFRDSGFRLLSWMPGLAGPFPALTARCKHTVVFGRIPSAIQCPVYSATSLN
eukprot:1157654-Pelagomonas_calceolata.AAC.8